MVAYAYERQAQGGARYRFGETGGTFDYAPYSPFVISQQTLLLSYASERVISRGLNGSPPQPDVIEKPGLRIDFVAREAMDFLGKEIELKFEARNITARKHEEFQQSGANRIDVNTYDLGRTLTLSASVTF